jgi:hypothetical protein
MASLQEIVAEVHDGSSHYWMFYHPDELQGGLELVEVRLNATEAAVADFVPPDTWEVDRVQWGDTVFLRRRQSLAPEAVETMLVEMLEFAHDRGMRLHSWLHGADAEIRRVD